VTQFELLIARAAQSQRRSDVNDPPLLFAGSVLLATNNADALEISETDSKSFTIS
jgi:hypothetical protein